MAYDLFLMWMGAATMLFVVWTADRMEFRRRRENARRMCGERETIASYNATVVVDKDGYATWCDNDRIKVIDTEKRKK